ncbi:MAG TPA: hypothetical protein VKJ47_03140, partial [Candidatus Binatia bacterium]|nr:hypothetical protein [Candidatus Binatia bacterium]
ASCRQRPGAAGDRRAEGRLLAVARRLGNRVGRDEPVILPSPERASVGARRGARRRQWRLVRKLPGPASSTPTEEVWLATSTASTDLLRLWFGLGRKIVQTVQMGQEWRTHHTTGSLALAVLDDCDNSPARDQAGE